MKKLWEMSTWTLISHAKGSGTWLLHYWQLKHGICQYWESKYQKFSLDCPFSQKAQNFLQRSMQPCFKTWAVVRKWSHHPPLVSCATHLAKAQIQRSKKKKKEKWCLNAKPLLPPTPSCALKAVLAEPPGHSYYTCGVSKSRHWWESCPLSPTPSPLSHSADGDTSNRVRQVLVGSLDA